MKNLLKFLSLAGIGLLATVSAQAQIPYKVLDTVKLYGTGGIDYVCVDNDERRIYVPRGANTYVFGLDDHKYIGCITNVSGHGIAIDPKTHHGISSSPALGMFDTETLQKIKSIDVPGRPDGILFEPLTERVYVFSHASPSVVVVDPRDGSVVGTIDIGGAMEQAQSDGQGHVYADVEDQKQIAVIDVNTLKVTAKYDLGDSSGNPGGLGLDARNHILFAMCHEPSVCAIVNTDTGKVITTLPIGDGTDGGGFNPNTMEAWSSQRDGTLTVIKENSPTDFVVEQNVQTKTGCKTSALDSKNNIIVTICTERPPRPPGDTNAPAMTPPPAQNGEGGGQGSQRRRGGFNRGPGNLDVLWVGR